MGFVFSRVFKIKHCIFLCLVYSGVVNAYKVETHESLSAAALMQSTLNDSTKNVLTNLGLNNDINSSAQEFPAYGGDKDGQLLNVEELVKYGANFEDDGVRSVTHFFDPVNDRGLTFGLKLGARSVDWALEDSEAIGNFIGIQEYSYNDANQYLFLALTAQNKDERDQNWGRLFQSIGQVVHHIQDMAQPDHVRNDQHLEIPIPFTGIEVPIDPSWYESYSNLKFIDGITNVSLDYQIPDFPAAREYWTTRAVDFDIENRRGMADFTNKNFVSKNTTFTINDGFFDSNSEYVLPIPHPAPITIVLSDPSLLGDTGTLLCDSMKASNPSLVFPAEGCSMDFVSTTINDSYTNTTSTNDRAATYSIFDKKLTQYGKVANVNYWSGTGAQVDRLFTLNKFNFDAAHNFLIPRAVAYSAGLINHFFSGEINLKYDNEVSSWVIENQSANEMEGEFLIYYEDELENRYWLNEINYSTSTYSAGGILQPFSQMSVEDFITPDSATKLIVVFKGRIGGDGLAYSDNYVVTANVINTKPYLFSTYFSTELTSEYDVTHHASFARAGVLYTYTARGDRAASFITNPDAYVFNDYYLLFRLTDSSIAVIEYTDPISCDWNLLAFTQYSGGNSSSSYIHSEINYPGITTSYECSITTDTLEEGLPFPSLMDMESTPLGYRTTSWSMGHISRYMPVDHLSFEFHNYWSYVLGIRTKNSLSMDINKDPNINKNPGCGLFEISDIDSLWAPYMSSPLSLDAFDDEVDLFTDANNKIIDFLRATILDNSCY